LVLLAVSIVVVSTQPVFLLGAAFLSIGPEFGFGTTGLGVLTAAFFLSASAASAPLGRLVQRVGWQRAVRFNATISGYLVAAAVDRGFTEAAAGWLLFAGSAASIAGRVTVGYVTDRRNGRGFGAMTALTAFGVIVFWLFGTVTGVAFSGLVLAAFATGWGWPGLMTFTVVNANTGSAARSSGITQAGIFFGAGAGPVVIGVVAERWGFDAIWILVGAALAVASVAIAAVGRVATRSDPT
jgi:MFS family permease